MSQLAKTALAIAALVFAAGFWAGYWVAPKEILDEEVTYSGFLQRDTKTILSATVQSLKGVNRLVSYEYSGPASVRISRDKWLLFNGTQTLTVPATVTYFVDMSLLNDRDVTFDESSKTVVVTLPKLMLSVAMHPERARHMNEGILAWNDDVVQQLQRLNYEQAKIALIKQAQQAELVQLARSRMTQNVQNVFAIPLRVAGLSGVRVQVNAP